MTSGVVLPLPFTGRWLVQNSPARRVPSHGTDLLGSTYAIDFVGVGPGRATADRVDWRTVLATEPNERFFGFGRPVLAPVGGEVVASHDGEADHAARRGVSAFPYLWTQAARARQGPAALAGNHVGIALPGGRAFVFLVHLRQGSVRVQVGERVRLDDVVGLCGSSGNSTQPHVHLQVNDGLDVTRSQGVPVTFRDFREEPRRGPGLDRRQGLPADGSAVERLG
ncbi:Peptidase family M23 [Microlunatus flavus]|uniref:Peptidase family M23 n=2 Tax=Microlunatus flavus TaxID=1036181 RepID=A0A1H9MK52_9ACTN|nr:Peptidase family M23 [Microlunatus flavus]